LSKTVCGSDQNWIKLLKTSEKTMPANDLETRQMTLETVSSLLILIYINKYLIDP